MTDLHLQQGDSATIGFVVTAAFWGAISLGELRAWADHALVAAPDCPDYMIELGGFKGALKDLFRAIGFVPSSGLSESQKQALLGIAFTRGRDPYDPPVSRATALAALEQHPEVLAQFRATFPFLDPGSAG
jgi:hypothetical protein